MSRDCPRLSMSRLAPCAAIAILALVAAIPSAAQTPGNVALNRPAIASSTLQGSSAAFAFDGNDGTAWSSGAGSPGWIEVDLGAGFTVTEVRLRTSQSPPGPTVHVITLVTTSQNVIAAGRLASHTIDGELLQLATKHANVRRVRIATEASPSWVAWAEIQVMGYRSPLQETGKWEIFPDDRETTISQYSPWVMKHGGSYSMFYCKNSLLAGGSRDRVYRATSPDGLTWSAGEAVIDGSHELGRGKLYSASTTLPGSNAAEAFDGNEGSYWSGGPGEIAGGKPAGASNTLPGSSSAEAFDGNEETYWNAGAAGSQGLPQWIEVDLGAEYNIDRVELVVAQEPSGATSHRVLFGRTEVHTFEGFTADGDRLQFETRDLAESLKQGVRVVRVETTSQTSWAAWREIRVFTQPWIEVDLGDTYTIDRVELMVAQSPSGASVHELLFDADVVQRLEGFTSDGDWLSFDTTNLEPSRKTGVRTIRVATTESPSWAAWREIRIFGLTPTGSEPDALSCTPGVVVDQSGRWHIYYVASDMPLPPDRPATLHLFHAVSDSEGQAWAEKSEISVSPRHSFIEHPSPHVVDGKIVLFFKGDGHSLQRMESTDGANFTSPLAVGTPRNEGGRVSLVNGRFYLAYDYDPTSEQHQAPPTEAYLAESENGFSFANETFLFAASPAPVSDDSWDGLYVWGPMFVQDGQQSRVYYAGNTDPLPGWWGSNSTVGVRTFGRSIVKGGRTVD